MGWLKNWIKISRYHNSTLFTHFLVFFLAILTLSYFVSTIIFPLPWGTDSFGHMLNTERMFESNSLVEYYESVFSEEYLGYDYPFGLWYFGSILMKITGMNISEFIIIYPLFFLLITFIVYYNYAIKLLKKNEWALLSLIFFVSMPMLATNFLNYSTSRFVPIFLIMIICIAIDDNKKWQNIPIIISIPFLLAITHTGTYMFLIFFTTSYFLVYAGLYKKIDWWMFLITVITLIMYVIAVQEFQFVQPQYIDKGRMIISSADTIASISGLDIIREMGNIFYENIFVTNNMTYVLFWSSTIFFAGFLLMWIHKRSEEKINSLRLSIPFIGNISNVSHDFIMTPFWIGPIHSVLSAFGVFLLDAKGKCIFCAILISAVIPASMQSGEGTGALREIYYLFLIIPITAVAGFVFLYPKIQEKILSPKKKIINLFLLVLIFVPLIAAPIIGSIYYVPQISGSKNDKDNFIWLSSIGSPVEGVSGWAHRDEITIYTQKKTPNIESGTESKNYAKNLMSIYFIPNSYDALNELSLQNIQYYITSSYILEQYNAKPEALKIDLNTQLDKIFSSDNNFGIYHTYDQTSPQNFESQIQNLAVDNVIFDEQQGIIKDGGSSYLFENYYQKIRISKKSPVIDYFGTPTKNYIGDGFFDDSVYFYSRAIEDFEGFSLDFSDIEFDSIICSGNSIRYNSIVPVPNSSENLATLQVTYTFLEKGMKRDIEIINDWRDNSTSNLGIIFTNSMFMPLSEFEFSDLSEDQKKTVSKKIYPSQGNIKLQDTAIERLYLDSGENGMLIKYGGLTPFPNVISFGGSEYYEYGNIYLQTVYDPGPGEAAKFDQLFVVGERDEANRIIDTYTSVSLYDYPEGMIPLVILNPYLDGENTDWSSILNYNIPESSLIPFTITSYGTIKDYQSQNDELINMNSGKSSKGIILPRLQYNLDTIRTLDANNMKILAGRPVSPPFNYMNREGTRNLKELFYHGEQTGVILAPISLPQSGVIGRGSNYEEVLINWKDTINTVVDDGGIVIFFWNPSDFKSTGLFSEYNDLMDYAINKGVTLTSLDPLVRHQSLIKNIHINAMKEIDTITMNIHNQNQQGVTGVTCKVVLPKIEDTCPYKVSENGRIVRTDEDLEKCILYVASDIEAGESKEIVIEPALTRRRFGIDFSKLYHGTNLMEILDDEGNPVKEAFVTIDTRTYKSNEEGEVSFYVRRGVHNISVEKPGFRSRQVYIDIKSKIFRYFDLIPFFNSATDYT